MDKVNFKLILCIVTYILLIVKVIRYKLVVLTFKLTDFVIDIPAKLDYITKLTACLMCIKSLASRIINKLNSSCLVICNISNICVFAKISWHKILITNNLILIFYNSTITCDWLCINWFNLSWIGLIISVVNPCFISTRISSDYLTQLLVLINNVGRLLNVWVNNRVNATVIGIICTLTISKRTTLNYLLTIIITTLLINYIVHGACPFTVIFREGNRNAIMIILGAAVGIMEFRNKSTTIISDIV